MAGSLSDISVETVVEMLRKYRNDPHEMEFVKNSLIKGGCPRARVERAEIMLGGGQSRASPLDTKGFGTEEKIKPERQSVSKPLFSFAKPLFSKPEKQPPAKPSYIPPPVQKPVLPKQEISRQAGSFHSPNLKYMLFLLIGLAAVILIIILILNGPKNCGNDLKCFTDIANRCGSAKFQNVIADADFKYSVNDCVLRKKVMSLAEDEPLDVKKRFEGKTMLCDYKINFFDAKFVMDIAGGIQKCRGPLAEAILYG